MPSKRGNAASTRESGGEDSKAPSAGFVSDVNTENTIVESAAANEEETPGGSTREVKESVLDSDSSKQKASASETEAAQSGRTASSRISTSSPSSHFSSNFGMDRVNVFDYEAVMNQVLASLPSRPDASSALGDQASLSLSATAPQQPSISTASAYAVSTQASSETTKRGSDEDNDSKPAALPRNSQQSAPAPSGAPPTGNADPIESDVLFGRGKPLLNHPGNKNMRRIADLHRATYDKADRDDKTEITRKIVGMVKADGARFLKFDQASKGWVEVSDEVARRKVAHAMRDGRSKPLGRLDPDDFEPKTG